MCARGLSVHECVLLCVCARVCRGNGVTRGCRRLLCGATCGSEQLNASRLLVPGRHLVLLHSRTSLSPAAPSAFLGGRSAPALSVATTPPRVPLPGERGNTGAGAHGGRGRKGRAGRGRAAAPGWRWEQPGLQHCYTHAGPPRAALPPPRSRAPARLQQREEAAAPGGCGQVGGGARQEAPAAGK